MTSSPPKCTPRDRSPASASRQNAPFSRLTRSSLGISTVPYPISRRLSFLMGAGLVVSCGGQEPPPPRVANQLALVSGDGQTARTGELLASPIVLNGPAIGSPNALPTALNVSFLGCRGDLLLVALDLAGVACSTGSACSSGSLLPSPVLQAMGIPDDVLRSALRFSFDTAIELSAIDEAAARIANAVQKMRKH